MDKIRYFDTDFMTENGAQIALPHVMAAETLYIKNRRGEFEKIILASYWVGEELRYIDGSGIEHNDDGEQTRRFNRSQNK